jgi:hypothetical protein
MLVQLLAIFGAIIVVLVIMYVIMRYVKHKSNVSKQWPSNQYMNEEGQRCPSFWQYVGMEGDNYRCRNSFNIPVNPNPPGGFQCYNASTTNKEAEFKRIRQFPRKEGPEMDRVLKSRCEWIKNCGATINEQGNHVPAYASWDGLDQYC